MVANPKSFTEAVSSAKREEYNDQIVSGTAPWLKQQQAPTQTIQEGISHSSAAQVSLNAISSQGVTSTMSGVDGELLKQVKDLMITQQQMLNSLREEIRGKNNTSNRTPQKSPGRNLCN